MDCKKFLCVAAFTFLGSFALPFIEIIIKKIDAYIYARVHGINKLMRAAANNDFKTVGRCLQNGYDINAQSKDGYSALILAAMSKMTDVVMLKCLLASGANPNLQDNNGGTALIYAFLAEKKECMDALIEAGAVVNVRESDDNKVLTLEALLKDANIKDIEQSYHDPNIAVSLLQTYDPKSKTILFSEDGDPHPFIVQIKDDSHDWLFLKYTDMLGIAMLDSYVIYEKGIKNVVNLCYEHGKVWGYLCGRYKRDSLTIFVGRSLETISPISDQEANPEVKFLLADVCLIDDSNGEKVNIEDLMDTIIKERDVKNSTISANDDNSKGN